LVWPKPVFQPFHRSLSSGPRKGNSEGSPRTESSPIFGDENHG